MAWFGNGTVRQYATLAMHIVVCWALTTTSITFAAAGPCAMAIARVQAEVDTKLNSWAGAGPNGRETRGAMLHHQPTPRSIAQAEQQLGEGSAGLGAVRALKRAREADRANDSLACQRALLEARRAIRP